uniref:Uncharacterized protein n=1 Tax=Arundo donax TaxID=35708 RepID=A0A0A9AZ14_ARUDO
MQSNKIKSAVLVHGFLLCSVVKWVKLFNPRLGRIRTTVVRFCFYFDFCSSGFCRFSSITILVSPLPLGQVNA